MERGICTAVAVPAAPPEQVDGGFFPDGDGAPGGLRAGDRGAAGTWAVPELCWPDELDDPDEISLSPREREIVALISTGLPNKTVAVRLGISSWTVATHLRRVYGKLGVHTRAAMVMRAVELGQTPVRPVGLRSRPRR